MMKRILNCIEATLIGFAVPLAIMALALFIVTLIGEVGQMTCFIWGFSEEAFAPLDNKWREMARIFGGIGTFAGFFVGLIAGIAGFCYEAKK